MDLVEHDMVHFDIILGIDYVHSYYAILDCMTRKVTFYFSNEQIVECDVNSLTP